MTSTRMAGIAAMLGLRGRASIGPPQEFFSGRAELLIVR
jgi:hypothetical protein